MSSCQTTEECKHVIYWDSSMYPVDKSFDKFYITGECRKCNEYFERYFTCDMFIQVDLDTNKIKGHWLSDFEVKNEDWE